MTTTLFVPAIAAAARITRRLGHALQASGHAVRTIELAGRFPDPDQAAIYAVRSAWNGLSQDSPRLIAGDVLAAFAGLPLHQVTALIQRPPEVDAAVLREVPRIVVPSETMQSRLVQDFGAIRDRIAIVAPGADPLPRSKGSAGPRCQILSIGALVPRKGHDVLMRALGRLLDLDWALAIAGAAPDQAHADSLRRLADSLGITDRVRFVDRPEWEQADLFALASHDEGYGMAFAEALRRGLPVAVTNVGAVPTLMGPDAGVVVAPGDADQLSKAIRRLIFDRVLRRDMAEIAWQTGQALPSWQDQAGKLAALIT